MKTHYLTISQNGECKFMEREFSSYEQSIEACSGYYRPRSLESTLVFDVRIVNGIYYSSHASLYHPEKIGIALGQFLSGWHPNSAPLSEQHLSELEEVFRKNAERHYSLFDYDANYEFAIESEQGMAYRKFWQAKDDSDEDGENGDYGDAL